MFEELTYDVALRIDERTHGDSDVTSDPVTGALRNLGNNFDQYGIFCLRRVYRLLDRRVGCGGRRWLDRPCDCGECNLLGGRFRRGGL